MSALFAKFIKDESGATAIEYGLIAALISLAIITAAGLVGDRLSENFGEIEKALSGASEGGPDGGL